MDRVLCFVKANPRGIAWNALRVPFQDCHGRSRCTYGSSCVNADLVARGISCRRHRVARLMAALCLQRWLRRAVIIDARSRRVVRRGAPAVLDATLTGYALRKALPHRLLAWGQQSVHRSNRGSSYTN